MEVLPNVVGVPSKELQRAVHWLAHDGNVEGRHAVRIERGAPPPAHEELDHRAPDVIAAQLGREAQKTHELQPARTHAERLAQRDGVMVHPACECVARKVGRIVQVVEPVYRQRLRRRHGHVDRPVRDEAQERLDVLGRLAEGNMRRAARLGQDGEVFTAV